MSERRVAGAEDHGLAVLIGSVVRREPLARYAGFSLLGLVACKALLVDTRTLTPGLRVVCLIREESSSSGPTCSYGSNTVERERAGAGPL
jgi:hypothetical protein